MDSSTFQTFEEMCFHGCFEGVDRCGSSDIVWIPVHSRPLKICVFMAVLKVSIVAVALILFGSAFQTFAAETIKNRAPTSV